MFDSLVRFVSALDQFSSRNRCYIASILGIEAECLNQALSALKRWVVEYENYH